MTSVGVVVVAAGQGARMGGGPPKQFRHLAGRPLVSHCLEVFSGVKEARWVVLVVPAGRLQWSLHTFMSKHGCGFPKIVAVVSGGRTRQESVARGLAALPARADAVLIHDAVRPFISAKMVRSLIRSLVRHDAVVPVCSISETVKRLHPGGETIAETVSRDRLVTAQTPQAFRLKALRWAMDHARKKGFDGTDEAFLLEKLGRTVAVIPGEPDNIKITHPEDWRTARRKLADHAAARLRS